MGGAIRFKKKNRKSKKKTGLDWFNCFDLVQLLLKELFLMVCIIWSKKRGAFQFDQCRKYRLNTTLSFGVNVRHEWEFGWRFGGEFVVFQVKMRKMETDDVVCSVCLCVCELKQNATIDKRLRFETKETALEPRRIFSPFFYFWLLIFLTWRISMHSTLSSSIFGSLAIVHTPFRWLFQIDWAHCFWND